MATINEPSGGWAPHSHIYEYYVPKAGDTTKVSMDFTFGYTLLPTETFVSLTVTSSKNLAPYGTTISGARVHGRIENYFEANGAQLLLTIRDRKTLAISQVNGFGNLPTDPTGCDVIEFNPPGELSATVTYTVRLETSVPPVPPAITPTTVTTTKTYTQTIHGTYQGWANSLVTYINNSGPFPRL